MDLELESAALALFEHGLQTQPADFLAWLEQQGASPAINRAVTELWNAHQQSQGFLAPKAPLVMPDLLGPWRLLERLSEGGMGAVFLAQRADDTYQQRVAIKLIRMEQAAGSPTIKRNLVQRFEAERQILARLDHPNIARILDGGQTSDQEPYLVMEYVDGPDLARYVRTRKLGLEAVLRLMIKVIGAVAEAHRNLIVHRDLKPENILVAESGEPKLLDFGIAKILSDELTEPRTSTVTAMGAMTPAYASPEQVRLEPITTASDIYSLGVLLYELLSGQRPYELRGLNPVDAQRMVCDTAPPRPSVAIMRTPAVDRAAPPRRLKGELDKIVLKAMHKDPQHRYASATAFAQDLMQFLAGRPVQARGDSLAYRLRKFVARNKLAVFSSAAVVLTLAGATWNTWRQNQAVADSASSAQQMNAFLIDVLANADPFTAGRETTLKEALYAAETEIDQRFADRPLLEAEVRHTIGYAALSRNDLEQAERLLSRADQLRRQELPPGAPQRAASSNALAWLSVNQGKYGAARQRYQQTLADIERAGGTDDRIYVTALNDYGLMLLTHDEQPQRALELFEKARRFALSPGSKTPETELSSIINNLARSNDLLGNVDEALALYEEGYALAVKVLPPTHPNLASYLNNRGQLVFNKGQQREGLELMEESLAMRRVSFSGDHPSVWLGLLNLSTLSAKAERSDRALTLAREATAMARRLYPEAHLNLAISLIRESARLQESGSAQDYVTMLSEAEMMLEELEGNNDYWLTEITEVRQAAAPAEEKKPVNP